MKIKGSSKIISVSEDNTKGLESTVVEEKRELENLVSIAEAADLVHHEEKLEEVNEDNFGKVKKIAKSLIDKTKPLREKQKEYAIEAVKRARNLSPHVDKLITVMDKSITYITNPNPLDGRSEVVQETRAPSVFGIWIMIITFGFFMMWAILAPLDSASHAIGKIILESKKRLIQHPEGGVIKEILVKDGDQVQKGQTLIILDDTQLKARKQQHEYKYLSILAEVSRLQSEKDGVEQIKFPEDLLSKVGDPEVQKMIHTQEKVFNARKVAYHSKIEHSKQNTAQYIERKNSILPQIEATQKLVKIAEAQVKSYKKLFDKGNVDIARLQNAEGSYAEYIGKEGNLKAQLAEVEQGIIQSEVAIDTFKNEYFEKTITELKENQNNLSVAAEVLKEITESLNRTKIKSPEAGTVSNISEALTPHGVLPHQAVLMEIIPQDDKLVVEAKISPTDIAAVRVGQVARVRLTAYRARIVPVLEGKVVSLSADIVLGDQRDLQMNMPAYYKARIEIDKDHLKKVEELNDVHLYPGMGVDVMIVIGTRTMMKYLLDPIIISLDHAFKEK